MTKLSTVVIVGRMNVGKSTFFNRLSTRVKSITLDYPGVTRDPLKDVATWAGESFNLVDSGGINVRKANDELFQKVRQTVYNLIEQADLILFMVDGITGILPEDREIANYLHKLNKSVILVVNKMDSYQAQANLHEFAGFGFKDIVPISAEHGTSTHDLLDLFCVYRECQ